MINHDALQYINKNLSSRSLMEQLADDAAELSHAALTNIRAMDESDNPTDVEFNVACMVLTEKMLDVANAYAALCGEFHVLDLLAEMSRVSPEWELWAERVKQNGKSKARDGSKKESKTLTSGDNGARYFVDSNSGTIIRSTGWGPGWPQVEWR